MGTVSFEIPGPGTYQVTCDPKLDPLANAGTAADILRGKQFYNDQNQVVTGTMEPGTDTGDATATAGDILAPKTAYTAAGKVTGTIPTKGAGDLTTAGATVSVPAGYYPESVYKTVTDPDLTAGNIKEGVEILGVTGSLRAQYVGILVVTVDSGAEVTATDGTTTLTETSNGTATFHLPNGGTWMVSAALNGSQAAPAEVEVRENFSLALSAGASQTVNIPRQYEAELSFSPTYTVTLTIDPAGSGTVTGAGKYLEGQQVTVKATPAEGYQFVAWKENENKPSRLPEGYAEVEYIQSSGTQYIDTNISEFQDLSIDCDIEFTEENSKSMSVFIASRKQSSTYLFFGLDTSTDNEIRCLYATGRYIFGPIISNKRYHCKVKTGEREFSVNDDKFIASTTFTTSYNSMFIFATHNAYSDSATSFSKMRLYSFDITRDSDGEYIRQYIPCIDPSGIIGLYDLAEKKFCSNSGTGSFTAGPEVGGDIVISEDAEYTFTVTGNRELTAVFAVASRLPEGYTEVEYISNPNFTYLLTGISATYPYSNRQIEIKMKLNDPSKAGSIFGSRYRQTSNQGVVVSDDSTNLSYYVSSTTGEKFLSLGGSINITDIVDEIITIVIDGINGTLSANDKTVTSGIPSASGARQSCSLYGYMFTQNYKGNWSTTNYSSMDFDLYSFKVFSKDGELQKDLVPCIDPNGKVGVYDLANAAFIGSGTSSKEFVAGPEV